MRFKRARMRFKHARRRFKHARMSFKHARMSFKHARMRFYHARISKQACALTCTHFKHARMRFKHARMRFKHSRMHALAEQSSRRGAPRAPGTHARTHMRLQSLLRMRECLKRMRECLKRMRGRHALQALTPATHAHMRQERMCVHALAKLGTLKASCTSSLRPPTLEAQGLIH